MKFDMIYIDECKSYQILENIFPWQKTGSSLDDNTKKKLVATATNYFSYFKTIN